MGTSENTSLFFADDVVLLDSSFRALQHPLDFEEVGMRVSTFSSEAMVLLRIMGDWWGGVGPLLLHIERSQLRCFRWNTSRLPPLGGFLGASNWKETPRAESELAGEITYLIWPGNASGSPRRTR